MRLALGSHRAAVLQERLAVLQDYVAQLEADLVAVSTRVDAEQARNASLTQAVGVLSARLDEAVLVVRRQREALRATRAELAQLKAPAQRRPRRRTKRLPTGDEALCKKLLALVHPDKWAAGQPAEALAHELTVALTAARAKASPKAARRS